MKIKYLLFFVTILSLFSSCKVEDIELFDPKGEKSKIQFGPIPSYLYSPFYDVLDTMKTYTFVYKPLSVLQDTAWFDIYTSGELSSIDRAFKLEQVEVVGALNAIAGRDYKAFDDAEVAKHYIIKANQSHARVPIVLFRSEELKEDEFVLQVNVVANDNFGEGEARCLWRKLYFSDEVIKPTLADSWFNDRLFGKYSKEKHRFMIGVSGVRFDDEYIYNNFDNHTLRDYYLALFRRELILYNESNPGNPLRESSGQLVTF